MRIVSLFGQTSGAAVSIIFISHSSRNNDQAVRVRDWLREQGWAETFLDLDPEHGLAPGQRWQEELKKSGERCAAVVVLVSPEWAGSKWCLTEFLVASQLGKLIFPVIIAPTPFADLPTELVAHFQLADISTADREAEGLDRLRIGLRRAGLDPRDFSWPPKDDPARSPYRGLQTLEEQDAAIFFGRDAAITKGLDAVRRMRDGARERLLVILGASGAGKSSFLRAGLLARLQRDNENFIVLPPMRPGRAALTGPAGLKQVLGLKDVLDDAGLAARLRELRTPAIEQFKRLAAAANETWSGREPTLILPIDQGEEFFVSEHAEAGPALEILSRIFAIDPNVIGLLTIRSDSFERLQGEPRLAATPRQPFDLSRLSPAAFLDVIEGPGRLAKPPVTFDPALSERLLADLDAADALPLLAFTLQRLVADHGADGLIELSEYESGLGGLSGAISKAVTAAFETAQRDPSLPSAAADLELLARAAFIPWLVRVDDANSAPKRRVAKLVELPEASRALVQKFIDERLLVSSLSVAGETTVEVSHEAVLRHWRQLAGWIEEERRNLRLLEEVRAASRRWEENIGAAADPNSSGVAGSSGDNWIIHRGERLADIERALGQSSYLSKALDRLDHNYITACTALRERTRLEELALLDKERSQLRRRRHLQVIVGSLTLVAFALTVAGGVLVWNERTKVDAERLRGQTSRAQVLANAALSRLQEGEPVSALRLAVIGAREGAVVGDVESANAALARILSQAWPIAWLSDETGKRNIDSYVETSDGDIALTTLSNGQYLVWRDGKEIGRFGESTYNPAVALARKTGEIVTGNDDGEMTLWREANGVWTSQVVARVPKEDPAAQNGIVEIIVSDDAKTIFTAINSALPIVWRQNANGLYEGQALRLRRAYVSFAVVAPDGMHVFLRSDDGVGQLWSYAGGRWTIARDFTAVETGIGAVGFSRDSTRMALAVNTGMLEIWDLVAAAEAPSLVADAAGLPDFDHYVNALKFSPDGGRVLAGEHDLALWNLADNSLTPLPADGFGRFTPDGMAIAVLNGGEFSTFDLSGNLIRSNRLYGFEPSAFEFAQKGARIVFTGWNETRVAIYDALKLTQPLASPGENVTWTGGAESSEQLVATLVQGNDGRLRVLKTDSGDIISEAAVLGAASIADYGFAPDGVTVAALTATGVLHLINGRTGLDIIEPVTGAKGFEFASSGTHVRIAREEGSRLLALPPPSVDTSAALLKRACEEVLFNDELRQLTQVETQRVVLLQGFTGADVCQPLQAGKAVDGRQYGSLPRSDMIQFRKSLEVVLKHQTGVANALATPAKLRGMISQVDYDRFRSKRGLEYRSTREIESSEVFSIFLEDYWVRSHANEMPTEGLSILALAAHVSHGQSKAIQYLQMAMIRTGREIPADGKFGPAMQAVLSDPALDGISLATAFLDVQRESIQKEIESSARMAQFGPGLLKSLDRLALDVAPFLDKRKPVSAILALPAESAADETMTDKVTPAQQIASTILSVPPPAAGAAPETAGQQSATSGSLVRAAPLPAPDPAANQSEPKVSEWGILLPSLGEPDRGRGWLVLGLLGLVALMTLRFVRRAR